MLKIFGNGNFYLELQDHGIPAQKDVNQGLMRIHAETGIPLIATNDAHYIFLPRMQKPMTCFFASRQRKLLMILTECVMRAVSFI